MSAINVRVVEIKELRNMEHPRSSDRPGLEDFAARNGLRIYRRPKQGWGTGRGAYYALASAVAEVFGEDHPVLARAEARVVEPRPKSYLKAHEEDTENPGEEPEEPEDEDNQDEDEPGQPDDDDGEEPGEDDEPGEDSDEVVITYNFPEEAGELSEDSDELLDEFQRRTLAYLSSETCAKFSYPLKRLIEAVSDGQIKFASLFLEQELTRYERKSAQNRKNRAKAAK